MSMLHHTSSTHIASGAIAGTVRSCVAWAARMVNAYIAKVIAHREYQANLVILRGLSDKELMDMGLNRNQIGAGLTAAAEERSALQEFRQRQSLMS